MPNTKLVLAVLSASAILSACASRPPPPEARFNDRQYVSDTQKRLDTADEAARLAYERIGQQALTDAYADGVRDTMEEFRGRTHGREGFVWEPPVIERVRVPAQIVNGFFRPEHVAPVVVSPGRWVEENSVQLPYSNTAGVPPLDHVDSKHDDAPAAGRGPGWK